MIDLLQKSSYLSHMSIVYIKGEFVDAANASISIAERGFRFGDGIFESIKIQDSQAKHLQRHLRRMKKGLQALRISSVSEDLADISQQLISRNSITEGVLRISASRGIGSIGYLPNISEPPTIVAEILPIPEPQEQPFWLYMTDWRKPSRKSMPVEAKLSHGINSTLAIMQAKDNECHEALILNDKGAICEASSANIFWKIGGLIYTPDVKCGLVQGIAREILLENWQVQAAAFAIENLQKADSVMICNSIRGAINVSALYPQGWQWTDNSLAEKAQEILNAA